MAKFEVREVRRWGIWRDGQPIMDFHGGPSLYETAREAWYVVENWEHFQMPTYAELRGMSDGQLLEKAGRLGRLIRRGKVKA